MKFVLKLITCINLCLFVYGCLQAEKIATLLRAANVECESYWPSLFAKLAEKKNIEDLIMNVGAGGGGGAPAVAAPATGGGAAAAAPPPEEKKVKFIFVFDFVHFSVCFQFS